MNTIYLEKLLGKGFKPEVPENAHSVDGVLYLDVDVGDGGRGANDIATAHTLSVTVLSSLSHVGSTPCIIDSFSM